MIQLYTWSTPNGYKSAILLEELGMPYEVIGVNIDVGDQKKPEFIAVNPNGRIPALFDTDTGVTVFESGAMLEYLAEKGGKFIPSDMQGKYETLQWLHFQMAGVGPTLGQLGHFRKDAPEQIPYVLERFTKEANRLYTVMNTHLESHAYFGPEYSIADMAIFPWLRSTKNGMSVEGYPNLKRWYDEVAARPAVMRAIAKIEPLREAAKASVGTCSI